MIIAILTFILLWPSLSWAAIAFDAESTNEGTTAVTNSHTFGASATFAYVCVVVRDSGGAVAVPTGVTVDGNAATSVGDKVEPNNVVAASVWKYVNPPTGTVDVVATGAAGSDFMLMAVRSYTGVDTTTPHGTAATSTSSASTTNMDVDSIASDANELGVLCGGARKGSANITFTADATAPVSTEKVDLTHSSGSTQISLALYEEAGASSTIDMRVDNSESVQTAAVGVSLKPAAGATDVFGVLRRR